MSLSLGGGYAYQTLYGVPITGGSFDATAGGDWGKATIGGYLEVVAGSTKFGLGSITVSAGPLVETSMGPVRLGGGVRVTAIHIDRATESGSFSALSMGLLARASVDLVPFSLAQSSEVALFLFVKGSFDIVGDGLLFSATGGAGVRF